MAQTEQEITRLLHSLKNDEESVKKVYPIVYNELYEMAHRQMRKERDGHTLNTSALVHEAYLKLVNYPPDNDWDGRHHFFGVAARAMRQILINYAKARNAQKRGGKMEVQPFQEEIYLTEEKAEELIHLEDALNQLEAMDERLARVVECRYFAGYTIEETADILNVSPATVKRNWTSARAWLFSRLNSEE